MRTFSIGALLLLCGCGGSEESGNGGGSAATAAATNAAATAAAEDPNGIDCALSRSGEFARACTLERAETAEGAVLTVRQPDGGFHRLRVLKDGRGVEAADGSQAAGVTIVGDGVVEVAIGDARYRLPARVGPLPKQ